MRQRERIAHGHRESEALLLQELGALLSMELHVMRALPKLKKAVATRELADTISSHTAKTKEYVSHLQVFAKQLGLKRPIKPDAATSVMLESCASSVEASAKGNLRDASLLVVLQRLEHYRLAAYASTLALAKQLGEDQSLGPLKDGVVQDDLTAKRFAQIAIQVNAEAFIDTHSEQCKPVITSDQRMMDERMNSSPAHPGYEMR